MHAKEKWFPQTDFFPKRRTQSDSQSCEECWHSWWILFSPASRTAASDKTLDLCVSSLRSILNTLHYKEIWGRTIVQTIPEYFLSIRHISHCCASNCVTLSHKGIIIIITRPKPARPSVPLTSRLRRSARKWEVMIFRDRHTLHHNIYIIIMIIIYFLPWEWNGDEKKGGSANNETKPPGAHPGGGVRTRVEKFDLFDFKDRILGGKFKLFNSKDAPSRLCKVRVKS